MTREFVVMIEKFLTKRKFRNYRFPRTLYFVPNPEWSAMESSSKTKLEPDTIAVFLAYKDGKTTINMGEDVIFLVDSISVPLTDGEFVLKVSDGVGELINLKEIV
ncbi:MAG: hypothetical protein IPP77_03355 [Bacteroidetes bacterium]|nr:hypothetical protein [Bacteroidota bacterium]